MVDISCFLDPPLSSSVLPFFINYPQKELSALANMAVATPGQLNLHESPMWGSRSVDCFNKLEQIGEGTYG